MKNALLVICPLDPYWAPPDNDSLSQLLQSIKLIGTHYDGEMKYLTGEHFLDLIAFMGCSPAIQLEPDGDSQPFCSLRLLPRAKSVEFHHGDQTSTPRCPHCTAPVNNWNSKISTWLDHGAKAPWSCEACQHTAEPWQYNWRKSAGFGRCFIEISNVFPKEAKPQQHLLDTLHSHYGVGWHYFYQY